MRKELSLLGLLGLSGGCAHLVKNVVDFQGNSVVREFASEGGVYNVFNVLENGQDRCYVGFEPNSEGNFQDYRIGTEMQLRADYCGPVEIIHRIDDDSLNGSVLRQGPRCWINAQGYIPDDERAVLETYLGACEDTK